MRFLNALAVLILLAGCVSEVKKEKNNEEFLKKDLVDIFKTHDWRVFNGNMELGEIGKPVPGYRMQGYFNPKVLIKTPERNYYPVTKQEKNGNKYLEMPGFAGLPEYNLYFGKRFLPKDGTIELSFKAKACPAEDGKFHETHSVILDFRCRNMKKQYGTVKERYPVLAAKTFKPEKKWKKYTFEIPVKANFDYTMMLRHYGKTIDDTLNGLCIDDFSLKYIDDKSGNPVVNEIALITEKLIPAYTKEKKVKLKINALLEGTEESKTVRLYVRKDYFLTVCQVEEVQLKRVPGYKSKDGRSLYSGNSELDANIYGSFNTVAVCGGKPLFSKGGDFITIRELPAKVSPLQRKLGGHHRCHGGRFQLLHSNLIPALVRYELGIDNDTKVYAMSGLRHAMYAFDLKKVQPQPKTMDFSLADTDLKVFKKYNIEPVGCLGGWWIYADRKSKRGNTLVCSMPLWFYDNKYTVETGVKKEARTVKDEYWRFHVNEIVKQYGKKINKWMVLVEPQWVLPAKDYFSLQKTAYEIVKKDNPNALFIAGDATSDNGYNLTNWIESLHKLGFEKYLDCVSFNPYGSSSDYIDGVLFRYSNLIERLHKITNPGTPLWQEELYYIANTKRKQYKAAQSIFSAGDAQRHYLLGLLNGLRGITAISSGSLYKSPIIPNDVCAGLNALSAFLSGKSKVECITPPNKLLRCGIFSDKEKQNCGGVIWALKAQGASAIPATKDLKLYDCFGNQKDLKSELPLGLDPVFLTGSYKNLKKFFTESQFSMGQPIELRARSFGNKTHLEAQNKSGGKDIVTVKLDAGKPPVRLIFKDSDNKQFSINGKLANLKYSASLPGMENGEKAEIIKMKPGREFMIPESGKAPLKLKIGNIADLAVWTEKNNLMIKAYVIDKKITKAEDDHLYNADALEIFIDSTPFKRLDIDKHNRTMTKGLKIRQYIFAPEASKTGKKTLVLDCITGLKPPSQANSTTEKSTKGYSMTVSIPLSEITPDSDGVIGMDFELSRRNGNRKLPKAVFTNPEKPSYKYRLHYPLFKIQELKNKILKNGNIENGSQNWKTSLDKRVGVKTLELSNDAYSGQNSLKIKILEEPSWGPTLRRGSVSNSRLKLKKGKYTLSFYAKGEKLDHMKVNMGDVKQMKILRSGDLPTNDAWTKYDIEFDAPKDTDKGRIYMEFFCQRRDKDSYAIIDEVSLKPSK